MVEVTEKRPKKKVVVIGAGAGGIATAARLAKAGLSVTVVEKNDFSGGRCSLLRTEAGFRFDQGPSLLLLPNMFRETFADLDTSLEAQGVELLQCHPNYHIWFSDGQKFESSTDTAAMKREVERWEGPGGFQRYLAWLVEAHGHYHLSVRHVLHRNFSHLLQLADPRFVWPALKLHPLESIWSRASRYFWTDRLRRVFTFATMYMGMSPFDAPSTYSLLQYTELAEGIWYPRGGFHVVLDRLVKLGEQLGVKYRFNAPVMRIACEGEGEGAGEATGGNGQVKGVVLESGETIPADIVVVNADLVYAYNHLLPQTPAIASYAKSLRSRDASCSSISFYWSLRRKVPELGTHNIFLADKYRESFDAIFKRHSLPDCPSFYINVPSRIDPSAAPDGCDTVTALVPVGHLIRRSKDMPSATDMPLATKAGETPMTPDHQDWTALVARARATVLETVQARTGCAPLAPLIVDERVNSPLTWEDKFNLDRGAILGLSHNFTNVLAFRPGTRARGLRGAYFVGASTHPGTGVPIVLAGAKITAEQVLADLGVEKVPWTPAVEVAEQQERASTRGTAEVTGSRLDQIRKPWWVYDTSFMVAGVVLALTWMVLAMAAGGAPPGFASRVCEKG